MACTTVAALADTNVLVYRFDPRFPDKQRRASELLRAGVQDGSVMLAHQGLVEFVAATTRPLRGTTPLLSPPDAWREVEELLRQFPILYPDEQVVRTAMRGAGAYQLSWFDAHMWAYAEVHGLDTLYTEDFEDGRTYGLVRAINPFRAP